MLMSPRNRAHSKYEQGVGGRYCTCCDVPFTHNKATRRHVKRSERNTVRRNLEREATAMPTIIVTTLDNNVVPAFIDPADVRQYGYEQGLFPGQRGRLSNDCIRGYLTDRLGFHVIDTEAD